MRSRMRNLVTRPVLRVLATALAAAAAIVSVNVPVAAAATDVLAAPSVSSFGMLGPVGLAAVGIGLLGLLAGFARRRREALARSVASRNDAADRTAATRAARVADDRETAVPAPSRPPAAERTGPSPRVQGSHAA